MSRNGSGTYSLPAGNPVVTGTTISSTWANNTLADIATALTGSIAADGQTTASGNLPMGGNVHTNVGNATLRTMYASAAQVEDGSLNYLTSVSGVDTITATAPVGMTAYATGQVFRFISAGANTGAATLNLNAIGAKAITKRGATALEANDIPSGAAVEVIYDGTQFQLIDPASASTPVTSITFGSTGLTPATATTGAVTVAGTLAAANGGTGLTSPGTSGNALISNGTSWTSAAIPATGFSNLAVFTSSGTFSVPSGVTKALVTVIGGGGGGGGFNLVLNGSSNGGGGGAGGGAQKLVTGLSGSVTVTIGAGGTAGGTTGSGGTGGTSSFGAFCSATGGTGGVAGGQDTSGNGGVGGVGSSGDINLDGAPGGAGNGTVPNGSNPPFGLASNSGTNGLALSSTVRGIANGYGAGAGGTSRNNNAVPSGNGNAGTSGIVIVQY